jgi:uncharacterized protein (TIGR00369 family)
MSTEPDDPPTRPPRLDTIALHDLLDLRYEPPVDGVGRSEVRMPVAPDAMGFTANLHGGAIATMVDLACALAAAGAAGFDPSRQSLVTADMHIRYLGRPRTDEVVAVAEVLRKGKQLIVIDCQVTDSEDHLIAVADFSMMIVPVRQPLRAGDPTVHGAPEL